MEEGWGFSRKAHYPLQRNLEVWIFALVVTFWVVVLLLKAGLGYVIGSGLLALGAWLLLYFAERNDATRQHELEISRHRIQELEAEKGRARERIRELEMEAGTAREAARQWASVHPGRELS